MLGCFVAILTLASAAYLAFRLRQFQNWKSESELCEQMQQEIDQLKSMVSDMVLYANQKEEPLAQESDSTPRERNPDEPS